MLLLASRTTSKVVNCRYGSLLHRLTASTASQEDGNEKRRVQGQDVSIERNLNVTIQSQWNDPFCSKAHYCSPSTISKTVRKKNYMYVRVCTSSENTLHMCAFSLVFKQRFKSLQQEVCSSQRINDTARHGSTHL